MDKIHLLGRQKVTDFYANDLEPETLVSKARAWAIALWERAETLERMGSENAMHTAAQWARVAPGILWRLRYRPPNKIDASHYLKLETTYQKLMNSVEGKSAENLIALRALPPTEARDRLVAQLEEFLGTVASQAERPSAQRAEPEAERA